MKIEQRLEEMGLVLPEAASYKPSVEGPPTPVLIRNGIAYVSGHSARKADGSSMGVRGAVPSVVSVEDAKDAAKHAGLTILSELKRALGDLDRVSAWLYVTGMVAADPGFTQTSLVISGFSDFIIELFGPEIGTHARSAPGHSCLAGNATVIIAAQVEIDGGRV